VTLTLVMTRERMLRFTSVSLKSTMRYDAITCVCPHNRQAASSRHAGLHHSTK